MRCCDAGKGYGSASLLGNGVASYRYHVGFLLLGKQGAVLSDEVSGEVCGEMFSKHLMPA